MPTVWVGLFSVKGDLHMPALAGIMMLFMAPRPMKLGCYLELNNKHARHYERLLSSPSSYGGFKSPSPSGVVRLPSHGFDAMATDY